MQFEPSGVHAKFAGQHVFWHCTGCWLSQHSVELSALHVSVAPQHVVGPQRCGVEGSHDCPHAPFASHV